GCLLDAPGCQAAFVHTPADARPHPEEIDSNTILHLSLEAAEVGEDLVVSNRTGHHRLPFRRARPCWPARRMRRRSEARGSGWGQGLGKVNSPGASLSENQNQ